MVEMARAARGPALGSQYNAFLYATIGAGSNGTLLSVLSAMARMNLDPWQEAADLTALSAKAAARRLATLIAVVPGGPPGEHEAIAARLVGLLPNQTRAILAPLPHHRDFSAIPALAQSPIVRNAIFVLIGLVLASMWFAAHRAPTAPPDKAYAPATAQVTSGSANRSRH